MKIKTLLICFTFLSIGLGFIGCNKDEDDVIVVNPPAAVEYTITHPEVNEMYTFECVKKSEESKEISATLTILNEYQDYLPALTITTENEETVTYSETFEKGEQGIVYTYTFTMPKSNITIAVDLSLDQTEYTIGKLPNAEEVYLFECVDKAKKNETVIAKLTILADYEKYVPTFILTTESGENIAFNETSQLNQLGRTYSYEFKMPGENVITDVSLNAVRRVISTDVKNVYLWIMNCYDKENPEVTSAEAGWSVGFHFNTELGYEFIDEVPSVTGDESDEVQYTYWNPEAVLNGYTYHHPCWTFSMPGEAVTIQVHATEKTTYADKAFTGEYKGYQIGRGGNGNLYTGGSTLKLNLKANTSYTVTSTDENKFDFRGEYNMDETTNRLAYVADRIYDPAYDNQDISMFSHAIRGQVLEDGDLFFTAENLVENSSENYRYYYASKEDCSYTCASTEYATYSLLEVTKGTNTKHYFFDSYNGILKDATVEFISGTSISSECEAKIIVDGTIVYKYRNTNNHPQFIENDKMNGTYTGPNGDLVLDGFGGATIGGQTGTYVLKNNNTLAVVTIGDVETTYVINVSAKTYTVFDPNAWNGPTQFFAQTTGTVGGAPSNARITVFVGTDLQGKETPGLGGIVAEVENGTNSYYSIISATSAYEYDAVAKTITFTNMLTKTDPAQSAIRNPVIFTVSDDLEILTSTHSTLYKYNSISNTINLNGVEIKAIVPTE